LKKTLIALATLATVSLSWNVQADISEDLNNVGSKKLSNVAILAQTKHLENTVVVNICEDKESLGSIKKKCDSLYFDLTEDFKYENGEDYSQISKKELLKEKTIGLDGYELETTEDLEFEPFHSGLNIKYDSKTELLKIDLIELNYLDKRLIDEDSYIYIPNITTSKYETKIKRDMLTFYSVNDKQIIIKVN
jgi:hypothetical protein